MELSRLNKKMILLSEKTNSLWQHLMKERKFRNPEDACDSLLGEGSFKKIEGWRKKPNVRPNINREFWSSEITKALGVDERKDLFNDEVRTSTFGDLLGLGRLARRYLFDIFFADINKSSFSSMIYNERRAISLAESFAGLYQIDFAPEGDGRNHKGILDVRYYMPAGLDSTHSRQFKIRCKLDFPPTAESDIPLDDNEAVEYDGFVTHSSGSLCFLFESRIGTWDPRILQIVVSRSHDGKVYLGHYLKTPFPQGNLRSRGAVTMKLVRKAGFVVRPNSELTKLG